MVSDIKNQLKNELLNELDSILNYWSEKTIDSVNGGFIGQIDYHENQLFTAEKGSVLNARILWTFSAAYQTTKKTAHKETATRAFEFLSKYFYDTQYGGLFWSINADTSPKDTKNQIYALAFAIYGLSEYYAISQNEEALIIAKSLYSNIQKHSFDDTNGGYLEAFTREWQPIDDLRLSDKDANEKKTMNTHLHIVEAYANLYKVWKDEKLQHDIVSILLTIEEYFINKDSGHLRLFFNENWIEKPDVISYGHDIEAAWLLQQCAEISANENLIKNFTKYAIIMADASIEGIDLDGGLWYEYDPEKNELIAEKHWWVQAEAMIGYYNAYQLTADQKYLNIVLK
ncbi:mannobiose 2-epimerase [Flavobacterium sp. PL11]|uniref:AGE family epimerase/isomerase n=1 Tax=Flavobacterium sp. PL11 TaxID=3071717 RepID=UPI002E04AC78|nr:mannobiose 2-epimerase [Flavobacterium sp. PL11]